MTAAGAPRRELRRTYSYTTATSSSIDRLQLFIAAWKQLPRSNPRRSTGRRLLSLVDPNSDDAVQYREIQPRGVEEARLWGGAPSPASMSLLQRELDALAPGTSDMRAALALGEPVSLTLDSFTPHGLGAFPNPVVPFYQIPSDERARRAVVHGSGCMSRNRATRSRPAPPMLVHQFVGQTLWLYWPCTPGNLSRLDNASWTGMVEELEQMHCVVLRPGECIFVPSMSSYITLSLGHEGTNIAAHLKYSLVPTQGPASVSTDTGGGDSIRSRSEGARSRQEHDYALGHPHMQQQYQYQYQQQMPGRAYPYTHNPHSHLDLTPRETRAEDTRSHDTSSRPSFEQRIKSWWRRRDRSPEPTPAMPHPHSQMMTGGGMGYAPARR